MSTSAYPPAGHTDAQLIRCIAGGDATALDELHRRYALGVFARCYKLCRDDSIADEATQDVFVQVWRDAAHHDDARGNVQGWLWVIARSRTLDRLRSRKRRDGRLTCLEIDEQPHQNGSPELAVRTCQDAALVESVLDILPDADRRLIDLAFFEGLTHREIATAIHLPLGTIKTRIRRTLQLLHSAIDSRTCAPFKWNTWDAGGPATPFAAGTLQNLNVLVVDDDDSTLKLLTLVLQRAGAAVVPASSAAQALRRLEAIWPDVLVTDLEMPDQDGYALLHRVRQLRRGSGLRAVAFTAHGGDRDKERAEQAGFNLHLPKPVRPNVLVTRLAELLALSCRSLPWTT